MKRLFPESIPKETKVDRLLPLLIAYISFSVWFPPFPVLRGHPKFLSSQIRRPNFMTLLGLGQMKILEGIPPEEFAPIQRLCEEVFYPVDTELAFDGEDAKHVFLLRKGATELVARNPKTGQKVVIARKGPGETMGFSSLIQPYQMNFTIHCIQDCHMYRIPRARLLQEQRRNPALYEKLRLRIAKYVFPNLEKALEKLQSTSEDESWYPQEEDLDSPGPKDGDIL